MIDEDSGGFCIKLNTTKPPPTNHILPALHGPDRICKWCHQLYCYTSEKMRSFLLAAALVLGVATLAHAGDPVESLPGIIDLTPDNAATLLNGKKHVLAEFYAPCKWPELRTGCSAVGSASSMSRVLLALKGHLSKSRLCLLETFCSGQDLGSLLMGTKTSSLLPMEQGAGTARAW